MSQLQLSDGLNRIIDSIDNEEVKAKARAIIEDSSNLLARAIMGENVTEELAHVKAQSLNLEVSVVRRVRDEFSQFVVRFLASVLLAG